MAIGPSLYYGLTHSSVGGIADGIPVATFLVPGLRELIRGIILLCSLLTTSVTDPESKIDSGLPDGK